MNRLLFCLGLVLGPDRNATVPVLLKNPIALVDSLAVLTVEPPDSLRQVIGCVAVSLEEPRLL